MALQAVSPNEQNTLECPPSQGETSFSPKPSAEIRRAIEQELEAICNDAKFRASERNCAFLRYVITETLAGRADEIKERILGKELFGRPISYDTGSDAVVRVRANEVRKRLSVYYESHISQAGWKIRLPLRTYVPVFVPAEYAQAQARLAEVTAPDLSVAALPQQRSNIDAASESLALTAQETISSASVESFEAQVAQARMLSVSHMVLPTLIALFLCAATFRWQAFSGTPYLDFWETLLSGHTGIALVLDADPADGGAVTTSDLEMIRPLLMTAAAFHASTQIGNAYGAEANRDNLLSVYITHHTPQGAGDEAAGYVTLVPASARAAGQSPELWIGSGNARGLDLAIRSISDSNLFPTPLEVAARRRTPTRLRFADGQPVTAETVTSAGGSSH